MSLTWLGSMRIASTLLNLDVLMCRVLLAINIAQMLTYNATLVSMLQTFRMRMLTDSEMLRYPFKLEEPYSPRL